VAVSDSVPRRESLRLVVQGSDIYTDALPNLPFARHQRTRNSGSHVLRIGGKYDGHLLVPLVRGPFIDG
jgi:uncharacterized protein